MTDGQSSKAGPIGGLSSHTVKHLEFIQTVVGRLGNNGFLVRGWAISIAGLFFGFAVQSDDWRLALSSVLPVLVFWGLDAYFLRAERLFRELYKAVVTGDDGIEPFYMAATSKRFRSRCGRDVASYPRTLIRPVLLAFYPSLLTAAALMVLLIVVTPPSDGTVEVVDQTIKAPQSLDQAPISGVAEVSPTASALHMQP